MFFIGFVAAGGGAVAQEPVPVVSPTATEVLQVKARAVNAITLVSDDMTIALWGVDPIQNPGPVFNLKARNALDGKIGGAPISCKVKARAGNHITAQCVNAREEDLTLYMLQQGYASVQRGAIYNTIFENPYIQAESDAQKRKLGIWAENSGLIGGGALEKNKNIFVAGIALTLTVIVGLAAISIFIMRGFHNVVDLQNQTLDLAAKERVLREKEKYLIAAMIDAEVKTNKSKIEAFITVYEEMLLSLRNINRTPKYQKSGDIVQKQPALNRSVFDGNTGKLDLMGRQLASDIIHYYARIKTTPDYVNLEPTTPIAEAIRIVEEAIANAKKLDEISDALTEKFLSLNLVKNV